MSLLCVQDNLFECQAARFRASGFSGLRGVFKAVSIRLLWFLQGLHGLYKGMCKGPIGLLGLSGFEGSGVQDVLLFRGAVANRSNPKRLNSSFKIWVTLRG